MDICANNLILTKWSYRSDELLDPGWIMNQEKCMKYHKANELDIVILQKQQKKKKRKKK